VTLYDFGDQTQTMKDWITNMKHSKRTSGTTHWWQLPSQSARRRITMKNPESEMVPEQFRVETLHTRSLHQLRQYPKPWGPQVAATFVKLRVAPRQSCEDPYSSSDFSRKVPEK